MITVLGLTASSLASWRIDVSRAPGRQLAARDELAQPRLDLVGQRDGRFAVEREHQRRMSTASSTSGRGHHEVEHALLARIVEDAAHRHAEQRPRRDAGEADDARRSG